MMQVHAELPGDAAELERLLCDDDWCAAYLCRLRWPEGFICPVCGCHDPGREHDERPVCRRCGRRSSVTSGTLMHGSKKRPADWLRAVWFLTGTEPAPSVRQLQHRLCLPSYQTAWIWMAKLRLAMQLAMEQKCGGTVAIDDGTPAVSLSLGHQLFAAVESVADGRAAGRMRMRYCRVVTVDTVAAFIDRCIERGSIVVAPDREPFTAVTTLDHVYTVDAGVAHLEIVQRAIRSFFRWHLKRQYRCVDPGSRQWFLDEFCFLQEAGLSPSPPQVFQRLLAALLAHGPVTGADLAATAGAKRGTS